jgi:nucleoside-diphosphate-sugar epimerase
MYGGSSLLGIWHQPGFEFTRGDVRAIEDLDQALEGVDGVVHLAAIVGDPACAGAPDLARATNLDSSLECLELSRRHGVSRMVFASTCSNYGVMSDTSQYATEESELNPVSLYAETKVAVERELLASPPGADPACTVLRFATLFGLSPRMRFDLTVNQFTRELYIQRKLVVYGEQFWRPYVHVDDAARAVAMVLDSPLEKVSGRVFNVGDTGENYQKGQLVNLICTQIGEGIEIEHVQTKEDPRDYRVSFEKIKEELGFNITHSVEDGVREIIDAIDKGIIPMIDSPLYHNVPVPASS